MKRLIIGNWKMRPENGAAAVKLFTSTVRETRGLRGVGVVLCVPFVWLSECKRHYRGKAVSLGAQDVSAFTSGSHTGEVSASMVRAVGATHTIVGHSERRAQGETDEIVREKVKTALSSGLTVVLCIGETLRDEQGEYLHFLRTQLGTALQGLLPTQLSQLIVAYEPIWAIGKTAADAMKPEDMHETSLFIRKVLAEKYTYDQARLVPILYGGSVEPENADDLLARGEVDGFLVGHASLEASSFGSILKTAHALVKKRG